MRTTVTLDDDVAAHLARLERKRKQPFKELLNEALREGLARLDAPVAPADFRTAPLDLGSSLIGSLDDVTEALAVAEGEDFR